MANFWYAELVLSCGIRTLSSNICRGLSISGVYTIPGTGLTMNAASLPSNVAAVFLALDTALSFSTGSVIGRASGPPRYCLVVECMSMLGSSGAWAGPDINFIQGPNQGQPAISKGCSGVLVHTQFQTLATRERFCVLCSSRERWYTFLSTSTAQTGNQCSATAW